jgi:hypothetical protein
VRSRQQQIGLGWLDIVSERLQHVGRKRQLEHRLDQQQRFEEGAFEPELEPQQPEQLGKLQQQVRTSVSTEKCSARAV